jgi:hypothetical protein
MKNMTAVDEIYSALSWLKLFKFLSGRVVNWYDVLLLRAGIKKGILMIPRIGVLAGKSVRIASVHDYNKFWDTYDDVDRKRIKTHGRIAEIRFHGEKIRFHYGDLAELKWISDFTREVYAEEQYKGLDVASKDVIDVGGSIGDTAMYFVARGARHVYMYEPDTGRYKQAKKNMVINSKLVSDRVTATNAPAPGLERIVEKYGLENAVLKCDCEGCEYKFILSADRKTLQAFSQLQIEYHYGYVNLKKKLEASGFHVDFTRPMRSYPLEGEPMQSGFLYAKRTIS